MERQDSAAPGPLHAAHGLARVFIVLAFVMQAVLWWRATEWSPQLPERFPIHFDIHGKPDGWSTSQVSWFLLPMLSLVLLLLFGGIMLGIGALARKAPALMNIPRKEVFLRLSPDGRAAVTGPVRAFLAWMMVLLALLFLFIIEGTARVAVGRVDTLPPWPVFVFLGLVFATLPVFLIATIRAVDRQAVAEGVSLSGADARRGA